ncbi:MAG: hypothetical protein ACRBDL_03690 [Alphaproteobacteria bacterium]
MDFKIVEKFISYAIRTLLVLLVGLICLSGIAIEANKKPPEEIERILKEKREIYEALRKGEPVNKNLPGLWPPKMNQKYPDIDLVNQAGEEFKLSDLKGRVLIVEYIDMSSPVSQAQSGGAILGAYGATTYVDKVTTPVSQVLKQSTEGELSLPHPHILEVKVIIYGEDGGQASRDDAGNWASHFNLNLKDGVIVSVPVKDMRDQLTKELITGYQLVDKNLMMRADSTGVEPTHHLKLTFAPLVPRLVK